MAKKHTWVEGFRLNLDADAVGKELVGLRKRNGEIDVDAVWQKAKNPKSAMHRGFTWDKDAAALKCWRSEARYILRHIVLVRGTGLAAGAPTRAYVSVHNDGYRNIESVLKSEDARAALVETVLARYEAMAKQYQHIVELVDAHEGIAKSKKKWEATRKKRGNKPRPSART